MEGVRNWIGKWRGVVWRKGGGDDWGWLRRRGDESGGDDVGGEIVESCTWVSLVTHVNRRSLKRRQCVEIPPTLTRRWGGLVSDGWRALGTKRNIWYFGLCHCKSWRLWVLIITNNCWGCVSLCRSYFVGGQGRGAFVDYRSYACRLLKNALPQGSAVSCILHTILAANLRLERG